MATMTTQLPPPSARRPMQAPTPFDTAESQRALAELFPDLQAAADEALADLFPALRLRRRPGTSHDADRR